MKKLALTLIATATAVLHAGTAAAQSYGPPERDITAIVPLYEYRQLHYLDQISRGIDPAVAKDAANKAAWDDHSPLVTEQAVRLKNARIVLINYDLLKQDFPFLGTKSTAEIDQWVLDKAAYIARTQVDQGQAHGVNTPIPYDDGNQVTAFRPYRYGRALLFPVTDDSNQPAGYIDVKGAGARAPRNQEGGHSNGLMTLGECIREYNFENLVNRVLVHARHNGIVLDGLPNEHPTVGSYAVIYTGFSILPGNVPAGLYLRQAHTRWNNVEWDAFGTVIANVPDRAKATGGAGHMLPETKTKLAKILALYNIWADETNHRGEQRFTDADIQGTRDDRLFDFGAYIVGSNAEDNTAFANAIPNHERARHVPFEQWGWEGPRDPAKDRPWVWAHHTASAIAGYLAGSPNGTEYRTWADNHFRDMVLAPLAGWNE